MSYLQQCEVHDDFKATHQQQDQKQFQNTLMNQNQQQNQLSQIQNQPPINSKITKFNQEPSSINNNDCMLDSSQDIVGQRPNKETIPEPDSKDTEDSSEIFTIYLVFCAVAIQNNFNTGVIPASLLMIEKELHLNFSELATLGSLEYLGISIASFIAPVALNRYKITNLIALSSLINGLLSILISLSSSILIIYTARFGQGICAGIGTIYAPIWVNNFSPPEKNATWMGILQSSVPLGVMVGYSTAAVLITITGYELSWRIAFAVISLLTTFTAIFFFFVDNKNVDILHYEKEIQRGVIVQPPHTKRRHRDSEIADSLSIVSHSSSYGEGCWEMFKQFGPILRHHLFIYVCFGICILFYIVTGIQYWSTEYFVKFGGVSHSTAMATFSFLAITAPIFGAIVGGSISDSLGGYKGKHRITALKYCTSVGLAALIFSIPIGFVTEFWQIAIMIWMLLCFGGALVPSGTGLCLSCLPKQYHSTSSSLSQLIYNIFGYFMCPLVSGSIMDFFDDKLQGLIWGWRSVLMMAIIAPFFFLKALYNEAKFMSQEDYENQPTNNQNQNQNSSIRSQPIREKRTKAWSVM